MPSVFEKYFAMVNHRQNVYRCFEHIDIVKAHTRESGENTSDGHTLSI